MKKFCFGLGGAALLAAAAATAALASAEQMGMAPSTGAVGTWINPKHTVTVAISACGKLLCGTVIAATPETQRIAREAGAPPLVGTKLLQDYRQTKANKWQGRVFVPDRNSSYYSTIKQIDADHLKISGCILGGLLCKSQVWQRVN